MKVLCILSFLVISNSAFAGQVLEPILVKNVSQYRNLMPGPADRGNRTVTLIKIEYFRCGGLGQESIKVEVKAMPRSHEAYLVSLYAPDVDCAGLGSRKEVTISTNKLNKGAAVHFENPVLIDYLSDVH